MTVGLSVANLANAWLNTLRGGGAGVTFTAPASTHVKLHTNAGDPGAAGTANASSETDRMALTYAAAAAGSMASSNVPSWATWDQGTQTIAHISVWDNATAGNFLYSATLSVAREVQDNDTLNLTGVTFALTPVAA